MINSNGRLDEDRQGPNEEYALNHGIIALRSLSQLEAAQPASYLDAEAPDAGLKRRRAGWIPFSGFRSYSPERATSQSLTQYLDTSFYRVLKFVAVASLIYVLWQFVKTVTWFTMRRRIGLEGMPVYGESLGCADAPYIFGNSQDKYTVPVGFALADHSLTIRGGSASGTLLLTSGAHDAQHVELNIVIRSNRQNLLSRFAMRFPSSQRVEVGEVESRIRINTPEFNDECMRYDAVLRIPPTLQHLSIRTTTIAQIKFDPSARIALQSLSIGVQSTILTPGHRNIMLLPHANIRADTLSLEVSHGWLVGDVGIGERTVLDTHRGDAVLNVDVAPTPLDRDAGFDETRPAVLETVTGDGHGRLFYTSPRRKPHRLINSTHKVPQGRTGDLILTYSGAAFTGHVDFVAQANATRGMQGVVGPAPGAKRPQWWVSDETGTDMLSVMAPSAFVALYFA